MDFLKYEKKYWKNGIKHVAGIDEAGRGPLAGPVVAASVIFEEDIVIEGINDSKKLSSKKRDHLYPIILENAISVGIGVVHEDIIDNINILEATFLAMKQSIGNLSIAPQQIIIDGPMSNIKQFPVECIIDGDSKSHSIAAASIIAKVFRDNIMIEYDKIFSYYDFINNKGYGTKKHILSLREYKACPIHRKSFKIVNENLPNVNFIEKKYGMKKLSKDIVCVDYMKNNYTMIDSDFYIDDFCIDALFEYNNLYFFIKIVQNDNNINIYNDKFDLIEKYIVEKDIKSNFHFIVNSVKFFKNKKPIIETYKIK